MPIQCWGGGTLQPFAQDLVVVVAGGNEGRKGGEKEHESDHAGAERTEGLSGGTGIASTVDEDIVWMAAVEMVGGHRLVDFGERGCARGVRGTGCAPAGGGMATVATVTWIQARRRFDDVPP